MTTQRWLMFSGLLLLAATGLAATLTPSFRAAIQNKFSQHEREVLATAEGDLLHTGKPVKVIKYRGLEGLYVDIVRPDESGPNALVERLSLPDKHDGLFNLHGHVSRLAIADIDQDGRMELLAPSFDNQLVPHLNVFRYNPAVQHFELVQPPTK